VLGGESPSYLYHEVMQQMILEARGF
jgi:hypothetical protein